MVNHQSGRSTPPFGKEAACGKFVDATKETDADLAAELRWWKMCRHEQISELQMGRTCSRKPRFEVNLSISRPHSYYPNAKIFE